MSKQHKPKKITEATTDELKYFASVMLNLEVSDDMKDSDLRALIDIAQPGSETIFVEVADEDAIAHEEQAKDAPAQPEPEITGRNQGSLGRNDPRAIINIPMVDTGDSRGSADVAVGVNGVVWQIKRGVDVDVPWRVVEALRNTEQEIVRQSESGDIIKNKAMRIGFNLLRAPSDEEIAKWKKETEAEFCP